MIRIIKDTIKKAKYVDLPKFLEMNGVRLNKNGKNSYSLISHDSLIISLSDRGFWIFYWNSRSKSGDAIQFVMDYFCLDFKQAIEFLLGHENYAYKKEIDTENVSNKGVRLLDLDISKDMRRVFAYLIKSRLINAKLIQELVKTKLLFQDFKGNVVLPWYDDNSDIVGAEIHGTNTAIRFKGVASGSKYAYGYTIVNGTPSSAYFFESGIDLMSFLSIHNNIDNAIFTSLAGLKLETLLQTINRHPEIKYVFLCFDNDKAGQNFIEIVEQKIALSCYVMQAPEGKDWNEYLSHISSLP